MAQQQAYDVIVAGVGAMGSAACYQLARRGVRVLGLEQFDIPHPSGSSLGYSRVTRLAYYEHPDYVPLLRRALALWEQLEAELGQRIFYRIGCLTLGRPDGDAITGVARSCAEHTLAHERLSHDDLSRRYPQFHLPSEFVGILDDAGGALLPEAIIAGYAELALRRGATIHGREAVADWHADGAGVSVTTSRGEKYRADRLIFCGGAWSTTLVGDLGVPLTVSRQVMGWVWPKQPELFTRDRLPVWFLDHGGGDAHYGLPMLPGTPGFKVASHALGPTVDPQTISRTATLEDEESFRGCLREHLPAADGPTLSARVCMYTNSPDAHFIVDHHPRHANVAIACGFSGHGFKFTSVMGELLADLATEGTTRLPIDFLRLSRFTAP